MSTDAITAKAVYEPVAKLEAFYTGGAVRITRDNKHMACACGDEVKVLDVASGTVAATLPGDSEPVTSLVLSPDRVSLVSASRSLAVKLWDWTTGECKRSWRPHRAPVADMSIDASGGYVATGSADRSIKVTDLAGGFVTHHFTGHTGIVLRVLFHPRQLLLFSSCDQGEVRVWDLISKGPAFKLPKVHMSAVPALSLAPDGWHLLSGGRDKVVCVWDIRNGTRVATIPVYEALEGIAVLPTGSAFPGVLPVSTLMAQGLTDKTLFFTTAGERGVLRIWRSDTGTCVYTHHGSSTSLLQQQQGGQQQGGKKKKGAAAAAAAGGGDGAAAAAGNEFLELMLLPGGKGLLAATGDARLLFYYPKVESAGSAAAPATPPAASELILTRQLVGNHDEITDLAFIYSTATHNTLLTAAAAAAEPADTAAAGGDNSSSSSSGGGELVPSAGEPRRLAVATNSHDIRLFELRDASCVGGCVGHRDIVLCLDTVRPLPGVELLASGSKDSEVRVWDPATCRCLAVAAGHVAAVTAVAWSTSKSKAGRYLATGGADKLVKLWDTSKLLDTVAAAAAAAGGGESSAAVQSLSTVAAVAAHDKDVNALAFSPNDSLLATASQDRSIKLWHLPTLVLAATLKGHKRGVWDLAFSPAEQVLLSCSGDKLLKLWSVRDGTCLRTFEGHTGGVLRCTFLTAGTQVLSSGADGLLKLWDTRSGATLSTFEDHEDRLWGLTASAGPQEALLASGGADARIVVWRDVTADKAAEAEAEEESLVVRQQELANALADGDYAAAARLAFQLRHPGRLLDVLRRQPGGPAAAVEALRGLVQRLDPTDLATALSYCREWNTNTRNAHLAQVLLRAVLSSHSPQQVLQVPGARELIAGLLAYSERHAARLDRLLRSTFLLDYTLAASQVLLPADAHDAQEATATAEGAAAAAAVQQGGLGGGVQMNGHHHQQHPAGGSSSSSEDDEGPSSSGASEEEADEVATAVAAAAGNSRKRQQQHAADDVFTTAGIGDGGGDDDGEASKPDPSLPGWGGGDDLSDDWAGPDDDEEEEDDMEDGGDIMAGGLGSGASSSDGGASSSGGGSDMEEDMNGVPHGNGVGASSEEEEEEEAMELVMQQQQRSSNRGHPKQPQPQQQVKQLPRQRQQRLIAGNPQQQQQKQQQQQQSQQAGAKKRKASGVVAKGAAAAPAVRSKSAGAYKQKRAGRTRLA